MAFGNVSATTGLVCQLRAMNTKGLFCARNDDLMEMLMLLKACECCFAGADLLAIGSALQGFGAKGADRSGTSLVESAPTKDGNGSCGTPRRPTMAAAVL
jgi:hypothetical protein